MYVGLNYHLSGTRQHYFCKMPISSNSSCFFFFFFYKNLKPKKYFWTAQEEFCILESLKNSCSCHLYLQVEPICKKLRYPTVCKRTQITFWPQVTLSDPLDLTRRAQVNIFPKHFVEDITSWHHLWPGPWTTISFTPCPDNHTEPALWQKGIEWTWDSPFLTKSITYKCQKYLSSRKFSLWACLIWISLVLYSMGKCRLSNACQLMYIFLHQFNDFLPLDVSGIIEKFNVSATLAIIPRTKEINKAHWLVHIFITTVNFKLLGRRISLLHDFCQKNLALLLFHNYSGNV